MTKQWCSLFFYVIRYCWAKALTCNMSIRNSACVILWSSHWRNSDAPCFFMWSGTAVRRALTRNTAVVVASAPGFPHGVIDHVESIAKVHTHAHTHTHTCARRAAYFRCERCAKGHSVVHEGGRVAEPEQCSGCGAKWACTLIHNRSTFTNKQMVKMQVCVCVCLFVCFVVLVSVPYYSWPIDLHAHADGEDAGVCMCLFVCVFRCACERTL
jgi:hypothetical protein